MSNQTSSESVSLELLLKTIQEHTKESKELRKDISELHNQVTQMKEILHKVLEKDKLRRSSSTKSLDMEQFKNEKHFMISPRSPRSLTEDTNVKRRATDSKLNYKYDDEKSIND